MISALPFAMDRSTPILIAGPTASGKSALALRIAQDFGGVIVNADALQVFDGWRILTARPSEEEESQAPHRLYGHVPFDAPYSVGQWLRDIAPILAGPDRPIIVGGSGLNFSALTEGLVDIPPTPAQVRAEANALTHDRRLADLSAAARGALDQRNPARVQRAWEVARATGRDLIDWQADTPPPLLALKDARPIVFDVPVDWLNDRIERRFDQMLDLGALAEARAMLAGWNPDHLSSKAIGAPDLIAHLQGRLSLPQARAAAILASRQYAKRQRTWFRSRMGAWHRVGKLSTG